MILLIDVGNSNIVFAVAENYEIKETFRYKTLKDKTEDELYLLYDGDGVIIKQ